MLDIFYFLAALASIISLIFNLVQWRINLNLKQTLNSTVCIGENILAHIKRDTEEAMSKHPADQGEYFKVILAHAKTGSESLSQIRRKQLSLVSRK